jgi:hypothetical protein
MGELVTMLKSKDKVLYETWRKKIPKTMLPE